MDTIAFFNVSSGRTLITSSTMRPSGEGRGLHQQHDAALDLAPSLSVDRHGPSVRQQS
jgi:hypothetical protein